MVTRAVLFPVKGGYTMDESMRDQTGEAIYSIPMPVKLGVVSTIVLVAVVYALGV